MRQEKMTRAVDGKQLFSFRWPKTIHPRSQVIAENFSSAVTSLLFVLTPQQEG